MIRDYVNQAANERTFLAWARTGIAMIALGFVVEKFNLFLVTIARSIPDIEPQGVHLDRLSSPAARYGGVALVLAGVAFIFIATLRFLQTTRLLADDIQHPSHATRAGIFVLTMLLLIVAAFSVYLAFA